MDLGPGDVFDRYTIESVLGEGGMGRVYRAYDARLDRRVALKVLLPEPPPSKPGAVIDSSDGPARVLREARAAAAFDHPNVVAIFDVGEAGGLGFISMELVEGATLRRFIGDPAVPLERRVRWLTDVARALAAAHARGLVHRDVKPDNVMVRDDGVVKVLDFGIARRMRFDIDPTAPTQLSSALIQAAPSVPPEASMRSVPTITQRGTLIGTPIYMAPEQVRGDPIDARVDQYAWGVTAYELLSGRLPFEVKEDALQLVAEIFSREARSLSELVPSIPHAVDAAILRAIAKRPEKRFSKMEKVIARLEPYAAEPSSKALLTSDPPASQGTGPMTPFARPGVERWKRAGALAGAAAIVVGTIAMARLGRREPAASQTAPGASPSSRAGSSSAEALAAYQAGMQAMHDASMDAARASFDRATTLDPAFAAALLRLAITTFDGAPSSARAAFQRAAQLRASLSDHDATLLEAMEPYVQRQPSDVAEWERRLERAVAAAPRDADYLYLLGNARAQRGDLRGAMNAYQRAAEVDPKFARALWAEGETQAYLGDLDAALRSLDACLADSPGATSCMEAEAWIYDEEQRCADVNATAKRWIATDGTSPDGYALLAKALVALGRPVDAVEAVLAQKWARTRPDARAATEASDRAALALLQGRFAEAEERTHDLERASAGETSLDAHARPALLLVRIAEETGRDGDAAAVAEDFLKKRDAYVAEPREEDFALAKDATPEMLGALVHAGKLGAAEGGARRGAWLAEWKSLAPAFRPYLWLHGYAKPARTQDDARDALEALPAYEPLPRFRPLTFADGDVAHVRMLVGDVDGALPILERAAGSCVAFDFPIAFVRAKLDLGVARERKGDVAGACAAYEEVIGRWGGEGRSRTARKAKERAAKIGCR
jgi:serine/threonine-protein kinase